MDIGREVALILLRFGIVSLKPKDPYVWQSGMKAPIYCDHRELLSFSEERNRIIDIFAETINQEWPEVEVIAGVETVGIPYGALIAGRLNLPFVYVRKEKKAYGKGRRMEGRLAPGTRYIGVIEDLISTGQTLADAIVAVRNETGAQVKGGAIFTYELSEAQERFAEAKIEVFSLSSISTLLKVALEKGFLTQSEVEIIEEWRKDPWNWAKKMGFEL